MPLGEMQAPDEHGLLYVHIAIHHITCIAACSDQPHSEAQRQQAAIEEALRSSRVAESSLQHSRRVGDLLLKNEDEEVQRVTEYAEELLNDEYRCM
jgi:hypothetical protein